MPDEQEAPINALSKEVCRQRRRITLQEGGDA